MVYLWMWSIYYICHHHKAHLEDSSNDNILPVHHQIHKTRFQLDPTFKNDLLQEMTNQIESLRQTDDMKCDKSVQTDNIDFDS